MTQFKIEITCPDCTYEDYQGCGDGYPWDLETSHSNGPRLFETREAAQTEADRLEAERYGGIWRFTVKEAPEQPPAGPSSTSNHSQEGRE